MQVSCRLKIGLTVVVFLIGCGLYSFNRSRQHAQRFYEWQKAMPIDIPVDLSQSGEFSGTFTQTCDISHGEVLYLKISGEKAAADMNPELFSQLRIYCRIEDSQGKEIKIFDFSEDMSHQPRFKNGEIELAYFYPFSNGIYTLYLTVIEGLDELKGVPQRLRAGYALCGLELMPAHQAAWMGLACFFPALVIFVVCIVKIIKTKKNPSENSV